MVYSSPMMSGMGGPVTMTMPQNWDDQTVVQLGVAYMPNEKWTVRAGYNHASNPIPDSTMNALFPAIEESHYTFGLGYAFDKSNEVNFSVQYAPEVSQTNPGMAGVSPAVTVTHSQTSWQLMYSKRF